MADEKETGDGTPQDQPGEAAPAPASFDPNNVELVLTRRFGNEEAKKIDAKLVEAYKNAGVEVVAMSDAQAAAWRAIAKDTSYKKFAENVPDGQKLIDMALEVE